MKRARTYDARLRTVASFVRPGAVLADVGSDHAYLPIALLEEGRVRSAIASDVNAGPIANADANIARAGLTAKITTICCDGVAPLIDYHPTDIAIAGMGGMLIIDILRAASFLRDPKIRLILQPMRDVPAVRSYLAKEGFSIVGEALCEADDKLYVVLAAEYTGKQYELTEVECILGPRLLAGEKDALFVRYLAKESKALAVRVAGLEVAGRPDPALAKTLAALSAYEQIGD